MCLPGRICVLFFVVGGVPAKTPMCLSVFLLSGEPDFFRIDVNDKISGVAVWRENRFSFPAQQVGSLHRDAAEHLVVGVNDPPPALRFGGFCGKRFHLRKRARNVWVTQPSVNNGSIQQMSRTEEMCYC